VISFMSANYVARELGFRMNGWGEGDRAANEAFAPLETFAERFDALLTQIASLGFPALDVWGGHLNPSWASDEHVAAAVEALARRELSVASYQVWVPPQHAERACEIAAALGTRVLAGVAPVDDPVFPALLEQHGLVFAYENHPEPTPQAVLAKIGGDPRLGVCVDTGWFATHGYEPAAAIRELGARVLHVHLKDVVHAGEPHETCRYGEGVVDIRGCVRALETIGYEGAISIEHEPENHDPSEEIRSMRAELERWLA
jgi:sugar phosphate isomerase/epimerase